MEFTINARKFDGRIHRSWTAELLSRKDDLLVFQGEFDREVEHPELGLIEKGTMSLEYYWLDRFYNVFRFQNPDGGLRYFYCNVNLPPEINDGALNYVDLDIDVLVTSASSVRVLDREEFEANAERFGYGSEIRMQASSALDELLKLVRDRSFPFEDI